MTEEKLTVEDLQNLRVALILSLGNPDIRDMPNIEFQLKLLHTKIDRLYQREATRLDK